ncbi:MAG: class I SAM-dependent methyltransferase [Gammaproteobacteria bacterium]
MANESNFWQLWAPYLSYLEDNHLDLRTINSLAVRIASPALVVGGGQGLLVDELQKKGLRVDGVDSSPEMIRMAEQRRGVKLVLTDGSSLPFADGSYNTSIIATGVVDFLSDEAHIRRIIQETRRVTQNGGKLLVSFYKVHPVTERFMKRTGLITQQGSLRRRRIFELSRLGPKDFLDAIRKEGNLGLWSALVELIQLQLFLPSQERLLSKNLHRILKTAQNADDLIASVSEAVPYRTEDSILALFEQLNLPVLELIDFTGCFVADIGPLA